MGHVFGLNDVDPEHRSLTMSAYAWACNTEPRTLGLGDYNGLIAQYGYR